ncbi:MAG: hypothetical protein HY291_15095 [Planctomycetes bacterium]|nr:hypothetical protein [Planctomycetota bacterium]
MPIDFDCTQCGKPLYAQDRFAGRTIRCPGCGLAMVIPVPDGFAAANLAPIDASTAKAADHADTLGPGVSPGEIVQLAFEAFKRNWLLGAAMNFLYGSLLTALILALWLAVGWSALAPSHASSNPYGSGGFWVAQLFLWTAASLLTPGLYWAGVKMADQALGAPVRPSLGDFFAGFQRPLTMLGVWFPLFASTNLLYFLWFGSQARLPFLRSTLATAIFQGALLALYGVYFARLFWALPLALETRLGSLEALSQSWRMTAGRGALAFGVWMLALFLYVAGFCFCMLGICFTGVLAQCLIGALYWKFTSAQNQARR